ncbi:MAG: hypothetical protein LBI74_07650, partial [Synergistaceae bacterium]|nr:hypothetical protein [Synergistaceae bacterium]
MFYKIHIKVALLVLSLILGSVSRWNTEKIAELFEFCERIVWKLTVRSMVGRPETPPAIFAAGFREIKWDATPSKLGEMRYLLDSYLENMEETIEYHKRRGIALPDSYYDAIREKCESYGRRDEVLILGDAKLKQIIYYFHNDRLTMIRIDALDESNYQRLKQFIYEAYGDFKPNTVIYRKNNTEVWNIDRRGGRVKTFLKNDYL